MEEFQGASNGVAGAGDLADLPQGLGDLDEHDPWAWCLGAASDFDPWADEIARDVKHHKNPKQIHPTRAA